MCYREHVFKSVFSIKIFENVGLFLGEAVRLKIFHVSLIHIHDMWPGTTKRCNRSKNENRAYYQCRKVKENFHVNITKKIISSACPAFSGAGNMWKTEIRLNAKTFLWVLWPYMSAWYNFQVVYIVSWGGRRGGRSRKLL